MSRNRWKVFPPCPDALAGAGNVPPLLAQLLFNRGLADPAQFEPFLDCDSSLSCDPFSLPDMPQAVARIYRALLSGDTLGIFGDFDADGVTAAAVLAEGIESLGGKAHVYLPHRSDEGHGLSLAALEEFKRTGVPLVVTVDCGITSVNEVEAARDMGIDVVVTDHHSVPPETPCACAVINPKRRDSRYPYPHLAGVGVAWKLVQALSMGKSAAGAVGAGLDLVALGTIADMSPLTGENRHLVKRGLDALNATRRPGLAALLRRSGLEAGHVTSQGVAWGLAPRINAAGRIEHARLSFNLLRTEGEAEADLLAARLDEVNRERQALVDASLRKARYMVLASQAESPLLFIGDAGFRAGVCGLVASKLAEEFHRPAVVLQVGEVNTRGSCRSIPEFNIVEALGLCSDLFTRYGGHPGAAGFSVPTQKLDELQARLLADARQRMEGVQLAPEIAVDAVADPAAVTGEVFKLVQRLAPFGQGNPVPTFLSSGLEVVEARSVGEGGQHMKMRLRKDRAMWPAIGFDLGSEPVKVGHLVDVVYSPQLNKWNGRETFELSVLDWKESR